MEKNTNCCFDDREVLRDIAHKLYELEGNLLNLRMAVENLMAAREKNEL